MPQPPQSFTARGSEALFSLRYKHGLRDLSLYAVVPSGSSASKCGTIQSASCRLVTRPVHPSCPFPPFLSVWMNVSSLTPWLLHFRTDCFSGSSGCFYFEIGCFFLWLWEKVKRIYLHLHLGWNSSDYLVTTNL